MVAISVSLIGLALTVSAATTLSTLSGAAIAFGVLGTLGALAAVVMGFVALARN